MSKYALVVGINDYSNWSSGVTITGSTWTAGNLNYCEADATSMASVIKEGFVFDQVDTLLSASATQSAIMGALTTKLSSAAAGDVVCLYFSGHGLRSPEDPTAASKRYYEAICCYDAQVITSMQIATLAASLSPSTVNFTIILDSCHSGGMVLSPDSRLTQVDPAFNQTFVANCDTIIPWIGLGDPTSISQNVSNITALSSGLCTMTIDRQKDTVAPAAATLFSACDYTELSAESGTIGHGYFTEAIMDTVNACNFQISHPDFLQQVAAKVAGYTSSQTPQLRGRPVRLQENFLAGWNYSV
jgi:uncharacterized caspase-like protein